MKCSFEKVKSDCQKQKNNFCGTSKFNKSNWALFSFCQLVLQYELLVQVIHQCNLCLQKLRTCCMITHWARLSGRKSILFRIVRLLLSSFSYYSKGSKGLGFSGFIREGIMGSTEGNAVQ